MPGIYATAMRSVLIQGYWPRKLLSFALQRNDMKANYDAGDHWANATMLNDMAWASCHPQAIRFMNLVSDLDYSEDAAPVNLAYDEDAMTNHVQPAMAAVVSDRKALWVMYGGHSFVILTSGGGVEIFEAWAGGARRRELEYYYCFHQSVLEEPAVVGIPRHRLPTRQEARLAFQELLSDDAAERKHGQDWLSRAGHGAFGGVGQGEPAPGINIHVADTVNENLFRNRLNSRLTDVGHYCQKAYEGLHPGRLACCHCLKHVNTLLEAKGGRWRECTRCGRYYCQRCKHLLSFGFWGTMTRTRRCDCGQETRRMY